jgi:hypothetical protein
MASRDQAVGAGHGERRAGRARETGPGVPGPSLHGSLDQLQVGAQVIQFLNHRGYPVPSPACLQQIGNAFRRRVGEPGISPGSPADHRPVAGRHRRHTDSRAEHPYEPHPGPAGRGAGSRRGRAAGRRRVRWRRSAHGRRDAGQRPTAVCRAPPVRSQQWHGRAGAGCGGCRAALGRSSTVLSSRGAGRFRRTGNGGGSLRRPPPSSPSGPRRARSRARSDAPALSSSCGRPLTSGWIVNGNTA